MKNRICKYCFFYDKWLGFCRLRRIHVEPWNTCDSFKKIGGD